MAKKQTETQRLRRFGFVMAVAFSALGAFFLWRDREWGLYVLILGGLFLIAGILVPRALGPIDRVWMALAMVMGAVMTRVILTITFFVLMTPMGILVRLLGKDLLGLKGDASIESYWVPVEPDGPGSRPDKPY